MTASQLGEDTHPRAAKANISIPNARLNIVH